MRQSFLLLLSSFFLSACSNFTSPSTAKSLSDNRSYWISYDASRRGALVNNGPHGIKSCSEPAPDVGLTLATNFKGNIKGPNETSLTNGDALFNTTVVALEGRNNVVLLAREALFRICEASMNGMLNNNSAVYLYEKVFEHVNQIAKAQADASNSNAKAAESQRKTAEAQLELQRLESESRKPVQ